MIKKPIKFFAVFLYSISFIFYLTSTDAIEINNIKIKGNERISDETIILFSEFNIGNDITNNKLNQITKNLYETNFFEDVKVVLDKNVLRIDVKEYPLINQLIIFGEDSKKFTDEIKKNLQLKEKKSFIKSLVANDVNKIKKFYESLGYNFSKVEAKFNIIDQKNVDLIFDINKGSQQTT